MRVKKRISVPLLLSAVLIGYALFKTPEQLTQDPEPSAPTAGLPDSFADKVELVQFDVQGRILDRTQAEYMRRFESAGLLEMDTLRRRGHAGDTNWHARADGGLLMEESNELQLSGDVRLRYESDNLEFRSASMIIDLDTQIATSTAPARIWQEDQETTADTLSVDLAQEQANMLGNVRARYVPER
ncbi:MAG: hypothetical protein Cons2KO_23220 [Congregibacter sp.]